MTATQRTAAKVPQDHLAKSDDSTTVVVVPDAVTFKYDGDTYAIPPAEDWDIEILEYAEDEKLTKALRLLLGEDQWLMFRKNHRSVRALGELFDAAGTAVGAPN